MIRISLFIAIGILGGSVSASSDQCIGKCPKFNPNDDVWLLPHEDCSKYCSCNYGHPIEMPCPPDLHFSPKDHVCTWPQSAECANAATETDFEEREPRAYVSPDSDCLGTCPTFDLPNTSSILAHRDCTKFCKCENGQGYARQCPKYLHFSLYYAGCTYPEDAKCGGLNGHSTVNNTSVCPCSTGQHVTTSAQESPRPTPPFSPVYGCIGQCPSADSMEDAYLAHEECSKFCQCGGGVAYLLQCPNGLHYNPLHHVCDHPESAQCTGIGGWNNQPTQPKPTSPPTVTSVHPTNPPTDAEFGCIGQCPEFNSDTVVHLAHRNCSKFCKCSFGKAYVMDCPHYQHFNPILQLCDSPYEAKCKGIGGWGSNGNDNSNTGQPSKPSATELGCVSECPRTDDQGIVNIAHKYCSKYCQCISGVASVTTCPNNLHFNPRRQLCDFPSTARCTGIGGSATDGHPNNPPNNPPTKPTNRPEPPTPAPPASALGCIGKCPLVDPPLVFHLAHQNCWQFCKCERGKAYLVDCPKNLHFNPVLEVCDYPQDAKCTGNGHLPE